MNTRFDSDIFQESAPMFSIITVVRNGREFVEQTIQSVVHQGFKNFEYIVIDGGSTDGTVDIIRSYERYISRWISEKDDGIASAFNKGLAFSEGRYVLFLNSDDHLAGDNVLETIAGRIRESGYPELIYGDYDILDRESGVFVYRGRVEFDRSKMRYGHVLPHPCLFTSRSYFEQYGTFDPQFRIAMDYEWLLRGILYVRVVHLPVLVSRIRAGGISTTDRENVVREIIAALRKNNYFRTRYSEYRTRAYFSIRALAKRLTSNLGIYNMLDRLTNGTFGNSKKSDVS